MDIIGSDKLHNSAMPIIEALVVRKAWQMLTTFGNENIYDLSDVDLDNSSNDQNVFEYIETNEVFLDDDGNTSAFLDQIRLVEGEQLTQIGYVALHLEVKDEWGAPAKCQQIIFRLETHAQGSGVFEGDPFDCERIDKEQDLLDILAFLGELETVMWLEFLDDSESKMRTLPLSETDRKFRYITTSELNDEQ